MSACTGWRLHVPDHCYEYKLDLSNSDTLRYRSPNNYGFRAGGPAFTTLCCFLPITKRGCPILALFARVGCDAADSIMLGHKQRMPYLSPNNSHKNALDAPVKIDS